MHLQMMALAIEDAKVVKGFIAMGMAGELFSIIITPRTRYPLGHSRVFSMEPIGLNKISNDFD